VGDTFELNGYVINVYPCSVFEIIKLVDAPVFYCCKEIKRQIFNLLKVLPFLPAMISTPSSSGPKNSASGLRLQSSTMSRSKGSPLGARLSSASTQIRIQDVATAKLGLEAADQLTLTYVHLGAK
jgi:hypothetical protein